MTRFGTILVALTALVTTVCCAVNPALCAQLKNELPVETRMRDIASNMRCPVCQGQSVYDSNSYLARQMKQIISEKLTSGETPDEIVNFFKARYGDYVLMAPPQKGFHRAIWFGPLLLALFGGGLIFWRIMRARRRVIAEASGGACTDMEQLEL